MSNTRFSPVLPYPIMDQAKPPRQVWSHPNPEGTSMCRLMAEISTKHGITLKVSNSNTQPKTYS